MKETTVLSRTEKVLFAAHYFLLWLLYFLITMQRRSEYMMSKSKGMNCVKSKEKGFFLFGSETTYYFEPTKKPQRKYLTWKEFWSANGY